MIINKVGQLLEEKNVTRYRFCKALGISPTTGYRLAKNPRESMSTEILDKICRTYGVTVADVLEYREDNDELNES